MPLYTAIRLFTTWGWIVRIYLGDDVIVRGDTNLPNNKLPNTKRPICMTILHLNFFFKIEILLNAEMQVSYTPNK